MTLGNILIRPQLLDRGQKADEGRILDIFVELGSRLTQDLLNEGKLVPKIGVAFQRGAQNFIQQAGQNLNTAKPKLEMWFAPLTEKANEGLNQSFDGIAGALNALKFIFDLLNDALDQLHIEDIERKLNELADILEGDLGLTPTFFTDFINDLIDEIAEELTKDFLTGDQSTEALDAYIVGAHIITIKRILLAHLDEMNLPTISLRDMIDALGDALLSLNWDEKLDDFADKLQSPAEGFDDVLSVFNLREGGSTENNEAGEITTRSLSRGVGDEDCQMSWYLTWFNDKVTAVPNRLDLFNTDVDTGSNVSFNSDGWAKFLEHLAHYLDAGGDIADALQHGLLDIKEGNKISPSLNIGYLGVKALITLFSYGHNGEGWIDYFRIYKDYGLFNDEDLDSLDFWEKAFKKGSHALVKGLVENLKLYQMLLTLGGSFEQYPDDFKTWLINNFGNDYGKVGARSEWSKFAKEVLLSFFTLINQTGNGENYHKTEGMTSLFGHGMGLLTACWWGKRRKYYLPDIDLGEGDFWEFVGRYLLGGLFVTIGEWIGFLVSAGLSGKFSEEYYEGFGIVARCLAPFTGAATFHKYATLLWNSNTDGGKAGFATIFNTEQKPENVEVQLSGYPAKAESPYVLPFDKNLLVFCSAVNLGFSQHNYKDKLIYAFDFSPPYGSEVLAMRGGTVESFQEIFDDDSQTQISILHNNAEEGPIPNPDYDKRENNELIITRGTYQNGQSHGVRYAFASRGIPRKFIIGTKIPQGHPIMLSGRSDGFWFLDPYNLKVFVGNGDGAGGIKSLPFVFQDIDESDGIPRVSCYYRSSNEPGAIEDLSLYHPDYREGYVQASGFNFIQLDKSPNIEGESIEGKHVFVSFQAPNGQEFFQYKKIASYDSGPHKLEIEGVWDTAEPPPKGAYYQIGGRGFSQSSDFQKKFAFLAARIAPPNNPPDRLAPIGRFQPTPITGDVAENANQGTQVLRLQPLAEELKDHLNERHIAIYRGDTLIQYKKIIAYDDSTNEIKIEGQWDINLLTSAPPTEADTYQIGQLSYHPATVNGNVRQGAVVGENTLGVEAIPREVQGNLAGRYIGIIRRNSVIEQKLISSYDEITSTITIDGQWESDIKDVMTTQPDRYEIGYLPYRKIDPEARKYAYLASDKFYDDYYPINFQDNKKPYRYMTYPS